MTRKLCPPRHANLFLWLRLKPRVVSTTRRPIRIGAGTPVHFTVLGIDVNNTHVRGFAQRVAPGHRGRGRAVPPRR